MSELISVLKDSLEAVEKALNTILSASDFALESVKLKVGEVQTLTGERNLQLTLTAYLQPREDTEAYEAIHRSAENLVEEIKRIGFQARAEEVLSVELNVTLKPIKLPT